MIRWVSAYERDARIVAHRHEVLEMEHMPVDESPHFNPEEDHGEGQVVGNWQDAESALQALTETGADLNRWVNFGVLQDEVYDAQGDDR